MHQAARGMDVVGEHEIDRLVFRERKVESLDEPFYATSAPPLGLVFGRLLRKTFKCSKFFSLLRHFIRPRFAWLCVLWAQSSIVLEHGREYAVSELDRAIF